MNGNRERLIKISQFMAQGAEDMGIIKDSVQNVGERLSELHLTAQTNQSELLSMMEGHHVKIENQFSKLEKEKRSK